MNPADHDENLPAFEEPLPADEGSLPYLLGSLLLRPPSVVPEGHLSIDNEEVVQTSEELFPAPANAGHIELPALSVEISEGVAEIEDLTPTIWFPTEDLAIAHNGHGPSGYNFLDAVAETVQ